MKLLHQSSYTLHWLTIHLNDSVYGLKIRSYLNLVGCSLSFSEQQNEYLELLFLTCKLEDSVRSTVKFILNHSIDVWIFYLDKLTLFFETYGMGSGFVSHERVHGSYSGDSGRATRISSKRANIHSVPLASERAASYHSTIDCFVSP